MKIHQITQLFQPDSLGGAALYTDFARFMRDRGHDVRVTTTFSYYPRLHYLPEDAATALREEAFEGIPLRRVAMRLPKRHKGWRRLIPELTYWRALRRHGRFPGWRPDVVFTTSPMLAQSLAAAGMYSRTTPIVAVVQDLMSEAARRLGIIRQPGLGRLIAAGERRALRGVTQLVTISDEMQRRLTEFVEPARPVAVIKNWIHSTLETTAQRVEARGGDREPGTLFYSGNLGVKQGLPDFLEQFLAQDTGWRLRIHGDGAEADTLRRSQPAGAPVEIGPLLPEFEYVQRLSRTGACLITQRRGVGDSFLPSKLLPALATGTAVLAVCEADSPLGREVMAHGFGEVVEPGDAGALQQVLSRWKREPALLVQLGEKSRERARAFERVATLAAYEKLLVETVGQSTPATKAGGSTR